MAEDFAAMMDTVARTLMGEPNLRLSSKHELRFGSRGSFAVDLEKGTWYDHEANQGGGTLDLIAREKQLTGEARLDWLRQLGLLDPKPNGHAQRGKVTATYNYEDENGALLFQVVRFEPKDFRQRRPDKEKPDGWSWSVRGVKQVPYRLPELVEALGQGHLVFVVEGERDVDNLAKASITATTNAGGVGKWKAELTEFFTGADVVIVPDYDPQKKHPKTNEPMFHPDGRPILPGQDHGQAVAAALHQVATRVRVLELWKSWPEMPLKGDISDWLKAGGTVEQLYALVDELEDWTPAGRSDDEAPPWEGPSTENVQAPAYTATLYTFPDPATIPPREWLYGGHYVRNCATATVAPGGFGKTTLTLFEMITMALEGRRVWFISGEDPRDEVDRRIAAHCQRQDEIAAEKKLPAVDRAKIARHFYVDDRVSFPLQLGSSPRTSMVKFEHEWLARLEQEIRDKQIDVVALDPFISFHSVPEGDNGAIDQIVKRLALIAQNTKSCIEISHHVRKPVQGAAGEFTVDDARGGGAIINAVRSCRVINRMNADEAGIAKISADKRPSYVRVDKGKRNMAPSEKALWWHIVSVDLPNGDNVQAIERYEFPSAFANVGSNAVEWVQKLLKETGPRRASSQADDWLGHDLGRYCGRDDTTETGGAKWANKILGEWVRNKVIKKISIREPVGRKKDVPFYAHPDYVHNGD